MTADAPAILRHPFSWRSRSFRSVVALLIFILTVRLIWGAHVERLLRERVDHVRALGEPLRADDVEYPAIPDSANAWLAVQNAAAARVINADSPRNSNDEYKDYPPYPAFWMKRAEASEKANTNLFNLARQARSLTRSRPRQHLTSPVVNIMIPALNGIRALANTLVDGAAYAHVTGDDAEALERLDDAWHVAGPVREDSFIVCQLVANGVEALTLNETQSIAPGLRFTASPGVRPAPREHVRRLIDTFLDDAHAWERMGAVLPVERIAVTELTNMNMSGTWFMRPLGEMDLVRLHDYYDAARDAATYHDKPSLASALSRQHPDAPANGESAFPFPTTAPSKPTVPRFSRWFHTWSNDLSRYFETHLRIFAERRATAVSLAAQLYRADHGGAWPARLAELVPVYLPKVPEDPFLGDGRPLGYVVIKGGLPGHGDRPLVYYEAGGGLRETPPAEPSYGYYAGTLPGHPPVRQYRDLARWTPPPATQPAPPSSTQPSTKAVEDQAQKADAPGNQVQQHDEARQP